MKWIAYLDFSTWIKCKPVALLLSPSFRLVTFLFNDQQQRIQTKNLNNKLWMFEMDLTCKVLNFSSKPHFSPNNRVKQCLTCHFQLLRVINSPVSIQVVMSTHISNSQVVVACFYLKTQSFYETLLNMMFPQSDIFYDMNYRKMSLLRQECTRTLSEQQKRITSTNVD